MEYKEIVTVTGEPGLFQLLSSKSDGAIVRSLDGQTTKFVPSRNHNFTPLESIEVFTTGENVSLADVFKAMQDHEKTLPAIDSGKDGKDIKAYFQEVFPSLDKERVYMSDMKKMLRWYPLLKENDLLQFTEEKANDDDEKQITEEPAEKEAAQEKKVRAVSKEKKKTPEETSATATEKKETRKKKPASGKSAS
jgi:hypothetical protein